MALVKDIGIVLRRLDYSETSQVLAMFTRLHGQQRMIAKGIKRSSKTRIATGIDLLELGRLVFSHRDGKEDRLATLTEWHQEDNFSHLRRDLGRCYAAQYAAEVTSHMTEAHDPHAGLFDGLHQLLLALGHEDAVCALVRYLWLMLTEIGLRPELSRCMGCGRDVCGDTLLFFSSRQGGAICRDCEPATVEKRRMIAGVGSSLAANGCVENAHGAAGFDLLDYHVTELIGRRPRLSAMVRGALGVRTTAREQRHPRGKRRGRM